MPASSAGACSSCPLWRAIASGDTSTTTDVPKTTHLRARRNCADIGTDLAALLTRRAGADPAWWLVVRQYALGHARWPEPFRPRRP